MTASGEPTGRPRFWASGSARVRLAGRVRTSGSQWQKTPKSLAAGVPHPLKYQKSYCERHCRRPPANTIRAANPSDAQHLAAVRAARKSRRSRERWPARVVCAGRRTQRSVEVRCPRRARYAARLDGARRAVPVMGSAREGRGRGSILPRGEAADARAHQHQAPRPRRRFWHFLEGPRDHCYVGVRAG